MTEDSGQMSRLSSLSNSTTATAAVIILLLVLVVVVVLECVSNILVKNFRFSRTSTSTSTKIIRLDRMHTPCAFFYFSHSNFRIPTSEFLTTLNP